MADTVINGTAGNDIISANAAGSSNGSLVLTVAGTIGQGQRPLFDVLINGVVVRSTILASADNALQDTQQVYVALPAGPITSVTIDYTNDPQTDDYALDRNLYIKKVLLNGTDLPTSTALYTRDDFTGPHNAENGRTIDGREDMNWGGEMTWTGAAVTGAVAGPGGSVLIDAGAGLDVVTFTQARAAYNIGHTATGFSIAPTAGGTTTYFGSVERLEFSDGTQWAIDTDGSAGTAAKMIVTLLGQEFLGNESLVGLFLYYLDQGMSAQSLAGAAIASADYTAFVGGTSNNAFAFELYSNLAGSAPSGQQQAEITALLDSGAFTKASLTVAAMEHFAVGLRTTDVMNGGIEYLEY